MVARFHWFPLVRWCLLACKSFSLAFLLGCPAYAQSERQGLVDEVSYTSDIRPVLSSFCTTCHAGDNPEGDVSLTSYKDVRQHVEDGLLRQRIRDASDPMPPSGLMPAYMQRLFDQWASQGYRNEGHEPANEGRTVMKSFEPPAIKPVDVRQRGFELLDYFQGHWVGDMTLMGQSYEWWAFDFRAISPSHVHGLFEGGTIGNLFTSFFVANFKGSQTIMARNGGLLNGIYRTSYFVLDQVKYGRDWAYYRLVDAHGGAGIMYMEVTFRSDTIEFNAYTSRFGMTEPKPHMAFRGRRRHPELAKAAAKAVGFPRNVVDYDFSGGLPTPTWINDYPQTTASYISEDANTRTVGNEELIELGRQSQDPRRVDQMPFVAELAVEVRRSDLIRDKKLLLYLSRDALVDHQGTFIQRYGTIREELLDTLLLFPEIAKNQSRFTFTYLHPGDYFVTAIADMDGDGLPSPGDVTHRQTRITVKPESRQTLVIQDMDVRN
ncbi:MAG: c-type cytochrome domain-containing protein [Planctomycetota bacterium]